MEAKQSPEGEQDVLLLNVTASLAVSCALLCVFAGYGVGARKVQVMTQVYIVLQSNVAHRMEGISHVVKG